MPSAGEVSVEAVPRSRKGERAKSGYRSAIERPHNADALSATKTSLIIYAVRIASCCPRRRETDTASSSAVPVAFWDAAPSLCTRTPLGEQILP